MPTITGSISTVKLPSGNIYEIKDAVARQTMGGAIKIKGTTTTALTDESTTNPITIDDKSYTAVANDAVFYNKKEFVFDGTKWHEFGDMSGLGDLAYADTASYTYTPGGEVSQPTFTGSETSVTITATADESGNYTPVGEVSQPTFSGSSLTSTGTFTPDGTVSLSTTDSTVVISGGSGTATYTPEGSVDAPTFTGTAVRLVTDDIALPTSASFAGTKGSVSVSGTPEGSVSAPTISVATAGTTDTINNPTAVTVAKTVTAVAPGGTAPDNSVTWCGMDQNDTECLNLYQIGYTTGDSITTSSVTVKTGDASYEASTPTFTGTSMTSTGSFTPAGGVSLSTTDTSVTVSAADSGEATYTPGGSNSAPTFTGTGTRLTGTAEIPTSASFTGTEGSVSVSGTPAGTVSQPRFTGTKVQIAGTTTAAGTVSQPSFTGTEATITVTPDTITP